MIDTPRQATDEHVVLIRPSVGWVPIQFDEIWRYRELFAFLAWRDIKVRYKQTAFGAGWAVGQPLLGMIVFTVLFGRLAGIGTGAIPYALFAYSGLVLWNLFANSLGQASTSLVSNVHLVSKIYFPRFALPTASVLSYIVDFVISFLLLLVLIAAYGADFRPTLAVAPLFALLVLLVCLGAGFVLAALSARYRDVKFALPFLIQIWFFTVPIVYPASLFKHWQTLYSLNPMVGPIEGFRWAVFGGAFPWLSFLVSVGMASAIFLGGAYYFRRVERTFADVI
jgi:lipopolysaccharide transport system permease protein